MMKKIAILAPNGWGIKNFLLNDFLEVLFSKSKVYVFTPLAKNEKFLEFFKDLNVKFEKLNIKIFSNFKRHFFDFLIYSQYFRKPTYLNQSYLKLYPISKKAAFLKNLKVFFAKYFGKYISIDFQRFLEKFFLGFDEEVKRIKEIYKREKIDLVFSTIPLISYFEHPYLFAAKELKIKTACIITSWDNLASKGRLPIKFDHYFVWNNLMKKELMEWYPFIKEEQVTVSGAPQFDYYFKKEFILEKSEFYKKIGAKLENSIILWAAASQNQYPNEVFIFENFYNALKKQAWVKNVQIVLRAHPIGGLERFKGIIEKYKDVIGMETNKDDPKYLFNWKPSLEDVIYLVNILNYSSIVINHCSTMTLDACAFDKPVINLAYDLEKDSPLEKYVVNCYKYDHYTCVLDYNAVKIVYSQEELLDAVKEYLENPKKDQEGRLNLLNLQISNKKGNSSQIIAEKLLEI